MDAERWAKDRADPYARERAFDIARQNPPIGVSRDAALKEIRDVLDSIGNTCPECPTYRLTTRNSAMMAAW
jgi:hypothetical protein